MDFTYDDEQQALREAVRGLVGKAYSDFENRRRTVAEDPGFSEKVWTQLAEMGVLGLPFDEEYGGMGAGADRGRHRRPGARPGARARAVPDLGGAGRRAGRRGRLRGAEDRAARRAVRGRDACWRSRTPSRARAGSRPPRRSGPSRPATAGRSPASRSRCRTARVPTYCVVSAVLPDGGTGLFVVDGVRCASGRLPDPRRRPRRQGRPSTAPRRRRSATAEDRTGVIARVLDSARIAACNEAVGLMEVALEMTSSYLKSRKQFGVTLNTFQALTFRSADMYVSLELARSMATWASMVLAEELRRGGRRSPRPAPRSRSAGPGGTSARRRSSCTAASA